MPRTVRSPLTLAVCSPVTSIEVLRKVAVGLASVESSFSPRIWLSRSDMFVFTEPTLTSTDTLDFSGAAES
ncbi:hypothetical protein D3C87_1854220 [compost metagenome]